MGINLLLLNSQSCLYCDNLSKHNQEIENIFETILEGKDYDCALICKYQDKKHKHISQKIESCKLSEIFDFISSRDTKNGIDILSDGEYLILCLYGQGYTSSNTNKYNNIIEAIKIMPYDENKEFIKLSSLLQ